MSRDADYYGSSAWRRTPAKLKFGSASGRWRARRTPTGPRRAEGRSRGEIPDADRSGQRADEPGAAAVVRLRPGRRGAPVAPTATRCRRTTSRRESRLTRTASSPRPPATSSSPRRATRRTSRPSTISAWPRRKAGDIRAAVKAIEAALVDRAPQRQPAQGRRSDLPAGRAPAEGREGLPGSVALGSLGRRRAEGARRDSRAAGGQGVDARDERRSRLSV